MQDNGEWVSSEANFTSLATPNAIGSGKTALNTLLHEGAPPLHVILLCGCICPPHTSCCIHCCLRQSELSLTSCTPATIPGVILFAASTAAEVPQESGTPLSNPRSASHAGSVNVHSFHEQQVQMDPCWGHLRSPHVLPSNTMCM